MPNRIEFAVHGDFITLGQLLKAAGIAGSGGEARALIEDGGVRVDGETETRRGRKLRAGDTVELADGRAINLIAAADKAEGGAAGSRVCHDPRDDDRSP